MNYRHISFIVIGFALLIVISACRKDDQVPVWGCTYTQASNWDSLATHDDGSCVFGTIIDTGGNGGGTIDTVWGCTDTAAVNYNPLATHDDGTCVIEGCMDPDADNYNPLATQDDGSCIDKRKKFSGDWDVDHNCDFPFMLSPATTISYNVATQDTIWFTPFFDGFQVSVYGLVSNKTDVDVPSQTAGFITFDGTGEINEDHDEIEIDFDYDAGFLGAGSCTATYTNK